jgi:hypothetical protein
MVGPGVRSGGGRALASSSSSVKFDVFVSLKGPSAAVEYEVTVKNVGNAELLKRFSEALVASGEQVPATLATTKSVPATVQLTSAPTPAPPPAVAQRAVYEPSATVKTLHKYMKAMGCVDEEYDPLKTVEAAGLVAVTAAVAGVALLLLFVLFVFLQTCCKREPCEDSTETTVKLAKNPVLRSEPDADDAKSSWDSFPGAAPGPISSSMEGVGMLARVRRGMSCHHAHISMKHHCRAKVTQTLIFVVFTGLLCGSIKGRDSFHKAADILAPALSKTGALFNEMEAGAVGMAASSVQFDAGYATLATCSLLIGSDGSRAATATMAPQIATFKEQGDTLLEMLKGQGAQLQKMSDSMAKDGKTYIDAFIGCSLAFGFLVALLGTVGAWGLSAKSARRGSGHFSNLFLILAQILGVLFVVLLIVLVALQASASAALGEVCYQPVPETALVDTLTQPGTYNVLKEDAFDVPTLSYYTTCNGTNALGVKLDSAIDQITGLGPELHRVQECDTLALRKVIPTASAAIATVRYALDCPRVNDLLLTFTRDAVCTHMVDGLFFLWTVQAASGVFLLLALVIMRLVVQAFHVMSKAALPAPTPKVATRQSRAIDMRNPMHAPGAVTLAPPAPTPKVGTMQSRAIDMRNPVHASRVVTLGVAEEPPPTVPEAAAPPPPPSLVLMEGRLEMKGMRRMQRWKHCRFSLDRASGLLSCFDDKSKGADTAVAQYHIAGARAIVNRKGKRQFRFDFMLAGGALICCAAPSAAEKVAWIDAASGATPASAAPVAEYAALPELTVATQSFAKAVC